MDISDQYTFVESKKLESLWKRNQDREEPYMPSVTVGGQKGTRVLLITVLIFVVLIVGAIWFILR